ncbi:MAG: hypothetical protein ABI968_04535 [Acidobacteriota bacterium]
MTAFVLSLLRVGGVALLASVLGWGISSALFPRRREFRLERLGWSYAIACGLLASFVPLSFLLHVRPGWIGFGILSGACLAISLGFRVSGFAPETAPAEPEPRDPKRETPLAVGVLGALVILGVAVFALQALTEPMWSNDFLAIWGLKGKTIFGSAALPARLYASSELGFSHPEYPLGLPFLYAGVSFLTGRWDDHAMALLFPLFQISTLAVLCGWLRRRGASREVVLCAAAILANFEPLYSGFLTGLAEVPLAFGLLLFGTALCDAADPRDRGALRRLALAAAVIAATKNEGLFFAAAGCALALLFGGPRRLRLALTALPSALLVHSLHLAWRGRLPLRDLDFSSFSFGRLGEALASATRLPGLIGIAGLGLGAVLIFLGSPDACSRRLLALAACGCAAYLVLPAFAVRGPEWLIQTTLLRTCAGLAPLVGAAIARRYAARAGPSPG